MRASLVIMRPDDVMVIMRPQGPDNSWCCRARQAGDAGARDRMAVARRVPWITGETGGRCRGAGARRAAVGHSGELHGACLRLRRAHRCRPPPLHPITHRCRPPPLHPITHRCRSPPLHPGISHIRPPPLPPGISHIRPPPATCTPV